MCRSPFKIIECFAHPFRCIIWKGLVKEVGHNVMAIVVGESLPLLTFDRAAFFERQGFYLSRATAYASKELFLQLRQHHIAIQVRVRQTLDTWPSHCAADAIHIRRRHQFMLVTKQSAGSVHRGAR